MSFSNRFAAARMASGLTLRNIADDMEVKFQSVQKWESGENQPRTKRLKKLADLLKVRGEWLYSGVRDSYDIRFGENLWRIRKGKKMSKVDVAEILSIPSLKHRISLLRYTALEKGEGSASIYDMQYIAVAFEIDDWQDLQIDPFSDSEKKHAIKVIDAEGAINKLLELVPEKILVNIYEDIEASAGEGSIVGYEIPTDHLWIEIKWLQAIVPFVPKEMAIIKVKGDSMEPTLSPGDMILIDRQPIERNQLNDGVYVINRNETTHVKRLQCVEGGIRIISDNKERYEPETVTDGLIVCGRVIWAWRGKRF